MKRFFLLSPTSIAIRMVCGLSFFAILTAAPAVSGGAEPERPLRSLALHVENDRFAGGRDDQYTSGVKISWSRYGMERFPEDVLVHRWLYPVVNFFGLRPDGKDETFALTTAVGQNIFTPDDIETETLIEDDRPYAGITYFELGYHQRQGRHMDTLEFMLGIVGPHSYAEEMQSVIHDAVNGIDPKGWDNQLEDEPVLGIIYEYKQKIAASGIGSGLGHDLIFNTGGAVGNAQTYYNIGGAFRWGWNIPDDFGNYSIRPATTFETAHAEKAFGVHIFLSGEGRAVIRNIFLDGNTFRDSHSVDKKPLVGAVLGGVGVHYRRLKTSFVYVLQSRTFEEEKNSQAYGSINISMAF